MSDAHRSPDHRRASLAVLAFLTIFLVAGPVQPAGQDGSVPDHQVLHRELASARQRWSTRRPTTYEFILSIPNGADWWSRRFPSYRVTGSSSMTLTAPTGGSVSVFAPRNTVDALFDLIEQQLDVSTGRVSLAFDEDLGYPTAASFDTTSFRTAAFRALARPDDAVGPFVLIEHVNHCAFGMPDPTDLDVCPTYSIAIWGDGAVAYDGGAGVRTIGPRQHRVDGAAVRELARAIETADFFALADEYRSLPAAGGLMTTVDHSAEQWVTIRLNGIQKTVHDFYGAPASLRNLERAIESATDSHGYTGRSPATLPNLRMEPTAAGEIIWRRRGERQR
jgi:hypothetical protein